MNKLLLITLLLMSTPAAVSQQETDCSWVEELKSLEDTGEQLALLKQNFGNCILVIADGTPVSSDTSGFYFEDIPLFVQMIRDKDVDTIKFLEGTAASTLYGTAGRNGVMVMSFKGKKTKYKILRRVKRQLRKSGKL